MDIAELEAENKRLRERLEAAYTALSYTIWFREFSEEWHNATNPGVVEFMKLRDKVLMQRHLDIAKEGEKYRTRNTITK